MLLNMCTKHDYRRVQNDDLSNDTDYDKDANDNDDDGATDDDGGTNDNTLHT